MWRRKVESELKRLAELCNRLLVLAEHHKAGLVIAGSLEMLEAEIAREADAHIVRLLTRRDNKAA